MVFPLQSAGNWLLPDRQVICLCGDEDFQMQGMEVVTVVNYNIAVKWFVFNNQSIAMVRDAQDVMFKRRHIASEFINPDFVKLAEAMAWAWDMGSAPLFTKLKEIPEFLKRL